MAKVTVNICFDSAIDYEKLRVDILEALKTTSDYMHDDIVMFYNEDKEEIEVDVFPDDLTDLSHSRHALQKAFDAIHSRI